MRPDQIAKLLSRGDGLTILDGIVAAATHFESYCAAPNQERSAEDDGIDPIVRALTNLLGDPTRDGELRGGAAWGLGKCLTDQSARVLCAALLNRKLARDDDELYQILIGMDNFLFSGRRDALVESAERVGIGDQIICTLEILGQRGRLRETAKRLIRGLKGSDCPGGDPAAGS